MNHIVAEQTMEARCRTHAELATAALDSVIPAQARVALLDYPDHGNPGDMAIWLGEANYLHDRGTDLVYIADRFSWDPARLRARIGDGIILVHGGGNLGDRWPVHQPFRERLLPAFPEQPVVLMPQSIEFKDPAALARARAVFNAHRALTIMVRDRRSAEIAGNEFSARVVLCPDMAMLSRSPRPSAAPTADVVTLLRRDAEARWPDLDLGPETDRVDWYDAGVPTLSWRGGERVVRRLHRAGGEAGAPTAVWRALQGRLSKTYEAASRRHLGAAVDLLGRGRVVVTDRIHGHILSLLAGIPHVVLPCASGKTRDYWETWTRDTAGVAWAETPAEGIAIARGMTDRLKVS